MPPSIDYITHKLLERIGCELAKMEASIGNIRQAFNELVMHEAYREEGGEG